MSRVFEYMKWSCALCRGIELLSARSEGWSGIASMLGGLIRPEILRCRLNLNSSFLFMFRHLLGYPGILVLGTGFIEGRQRLTTSSWIWLSQNLPERTFLLKARGESPQYHKACSWNPEHVFEHLIYGTIHCTSRLILLPFSKNICFLFVQWRQHEIHPWIWWRFDVPKVNLLELRSQVCRWALDTWSFKSSTLQMTEVLKWWGLDQRVGS